MFDKTFLKTVKDQHTAIGKQIAELQNQQSALSTLLKAHGEAPAKAPAAAKSKAPAKSKSTTTAPAAASGTGTRKGYVTHLLPFMFNKTEVSAAAMFEHLKSLPGNADLKRNSLDATVQNELKKGDKARIARVRPGVYSITETGIEFLNAEDRGQANEPEQPTAVEAEPEPEAEPVPIQRY